MGSNTDVSMVWLMENALHIGAGVSLAKMTITPNALSECHRHPNCTEAIYVLEGEIRQRIGDNWIEMKSGDTGLVPTGQYHQSQNIGAEPAILILAYSSGSRIYEAE